jgi:hypothetical protein
MATTTTTTATMAITTTAITTTATGTASSTATPHACDPGVAGHARAVFGYAACTSATSRTSISSVPPRISA